MVWFLNLLLFLFYVIACNSDSRCCIHYQHYEPNTGVDVCGHGDRITGASFAGRSPSVGFNGMAAGSQPLITQTALKILQNGGSAVDAAIAANAMQGLVEPMMNGIGGDIMAIIHNPTDKKLYGYNGSGRSSKTFSYDDMSKTISNEFHSEYIPSRGPYPITVPGALQGWCDLHNKFGKLQWNTLFEDAIQYASNGYSVTQIISSYWQNSVKGFNPNNDEITTNGKYPNAGQGFLDIYTINGSAPSFGELFRNPTLANVYSTIAEEGCDAFYRGSLTNKIVNFLQSVGSPLTTQDFNEHHGDWVDPVNTTYRDNYLISELPPNPQGIATLQMLNMMELYPFGTSTSDWELHSSDYIHANVEIKKLVFADRAKYYADPDYQGVCVPVDTLISKQYAQERNELVNMNRAADYCAPGNINCTLPIEKYAGDTIYMTTADSDGMMASWIQSNFGEFGSYMVSSELGFAFQDRGALFSLFNGSANQYQSQKRPFHTIIPAFMHIKNKNDGDNNTWIPYMSFGVMGGNIQPQGHVQIVSNIVDYHMNIQEAGDAARWVHSGSQQPTGQSMNKNGGVVGLESGICQNVANNLTARGHQVRYDPNGGGYQAILRDPDTGVYYGATEMRKDGIALGY